ncbi:STAS domain-containing protein [Telmatobacter bradus]|uniref:STAS domain-containing protein n=1 Tax=Telmatobacter bradus TaxID=474953 RepID=UPI003B434BA5
MEIHKGDGMEAIRLEGAVDIAVASELRQALLDGLEHGGLRLTLAAGTALDVTAVQLLCAAGSQARSMGRRCELVGTLPEALRLQLVADGFDVEQVFADYALAEPEAAAWAEAAPAEEASMGKGGKNPRQKREGGHKMAARAEKRVH